MERFGLPFHGLHQGIAPNWAGSEQHTLGLQLSTGQYVYSDEIQGSRSRYMKHPTRSSIVTPNATDTANGWTWQDYLLICGRNMTIGGTSLGDGRWLYVDGNGNVWVMRVEAVPDPVINNKITLKFYLHSLWGVFYCPNNPYQPRDKLLFEQDIFIRTGPTVSNTGIYDSEVDNSVTFNGGVSRTLEFNKTGSDCIMAVTHPQKIGTGGNLLFYFFDTMYAASLIYDYPENSTGWLTNIIRWTVSGNGNMSSDPSVLGDGIEITITRNDEYSFESEADPNYEGPPGYTGGKTFWLNISNDQNFQTEEFNFIGHYFFDENDVLHECRLKVDTTLEYLSLNVVQADYTASIVIDDGETETTIGSYSLTAEDRNFPYDDVQLYRPRFHFDRCGNTGVYGLLVKDPWHPSLPAGFQKEDGFEMAVYFIATPAEPIEVNGVPDTTRWHKVSDNSYFRGNLFEWPSYYDRAAWHPVEKKLHWIEQENGWDPVPCFI